MLYDVPILLQNIEFVPKSTSQEVLQNIITICSTVKGSVPLDREFGIDDALVDLPVNTVRAKLAAQYIDAVKKFETRAEVVKVTFRSTTNQSVYPVITVKLKV